jgi:DNA-binding response OmpR family regulator
MDAYFRSQYDDTEIKLSTTQLAIVEELKKHAPSVVSRDGIAQIMWGAKWRDKYSDWAIDQMIYAIRAVLTKYKSPWQLKTRRGKGYYVLKKKYGTPTF